MSKRVIQNIMLRFLSLALYVATSWTLYPPSSSVAELNPSNFNNLVVLGDEIWIVEFFAPWCEHCQNFVPEYVKVANALKGIVKVGAVNADAHKELRDQYSVKEFPTIKIFGANKNEPQNYQGTKTVEGILKAVLKAAKAKVKARLEDGSGESLGGSLHSSKDDVIKLTDKNFDGLVLQSDNMWLVKFFAPWCGHCKKLASHWAKAATELKGKVKLGALDATVNKIKMTQYKIESYPTIKFFALGPKSASSAEEYDGGRTSSEIVQWVSDKVARSTPAPKVTQVVSFGLFKEQCEQKPVCVVAVLPSLLDCQSECRNNYIKVLTELGKKFKEKMWGWTWSEAGAQPELESTVDIGGFGYPAMAVINAQKMRYSTLRGAFSKDGIYEFLRDLSYGKGNTSPVKSHKLPKIRTVDPWDGKDEELPPQENLDLSNPNDNKDEL